MGGLKAGFSEVVITPPVGVRLAGYSARTAPSTGVLDELTAKAVVLESGSDRLAIAACDLLELDLEIVQAIRSLVRERTGIEPSRLMVAATHTHCGPDLDLLSDADIDHLVQQVAGAVSAAAAAARPAAAGFGTGTCHAGINRRNRRATLGPYFLYNDPDGPMDPTVAVAAFRAPDGSLLGTLMNYACHPVTLGDDELNLSRDFVGFACDVIRDACGHDTAAIFLQGCAGNVNPNWIYDDPSRDPVPERVLPAALEPRLRETRRIGSILGGAALAAVSSIMEFSPDVRLAASVVPVELPLRRDLADGKVSMPGHPPGTAARTRCLGLGARAKPGAVGIVTEVQVMRIGGSLVVGLPGEIFVEWQMLLRRRLAPAHVMVVDLANDSISYLPTPQAFTEGGYEPLVALFAPEAGEILVEHAVDAARRLPGD